MKEENRIYFSQIREALSERKQIEYTIAEVKVLFDTWIYLCARHNIHHRNFGRLAWQRHWLAVKDANEFCNYCVKDWRPWVES